MLKKYLLILMLMLPAITLVSCGNDDDETNGSDNDSNSSWVKVGATKFSTKYSYVVLYDEGQYDNDEDCYSIVYAQIRTYVIILRVSLLKRQFPIYSSCMREMLVHLHCLASLAVIR